MQTYKEALSRASYPGRGIVLGLSPDGASAFILYFIMGRSQNSRNRVFVEDGDGIRTQAFDPAKLVDPSLVIYRPVRVQSGYTVVTNGDQTDTVADALGAPASADEAFERFAAALRTRRFEPDAPHYTPRVSAILAASPAPAFAMSILKSADGDPAECLRYTFVYEAPRPGVGRFLHTYQGDGAPLPSFAGEPESVRLPASLDELAQGAWDALDAQNRVSLFARSVCLKTGATETRIINQNQ